MNALDPNAINLEGVSQTPYRGTKPPGPSYRNPLGGLLHIRDDVLDYTTKVAFEYGGVASIRAAHKRVIIISRPEACEYITRSNHQNYVKGISFQQLKSIMGNGLLVADGPGWQKQRRLAQPHFNRPVVLKYKDQIAECTEELLIRLEQLAKTNQPVDIFAEMSMVAFNLVGRTLFGACIKDEMKIVEAALPDIGEYIYKKIQSPVPLPLWLPLPLHLRYKKSEAKLNEVVYRIIEQRRQDGADRNDLLTKLMYAVDEETGESLSNLQLRDEVMSLMLAGYETTADGMAWSWYYLAKNKSLVNKLHHEVDTVLNGRMATSDDLGDLTYTGQVIDETMRLTPPAWSFTRQALSDDVVTGYEISTKDIIVVSPYTLHRWPDLWPDPECFDPDRFAPEVARKRNRWHYLPFGAGAHNCIGQHLALIEMKTIIAAVAQRFHFELAPGYPVEMEPNITLRPKNGIYMFVRRRN